MRYIEYLYLAGAAGLMAILVTEYKSLTTGSYIAIILGMAICSFMYSFRRKQRQALEAHDRSEADQEEREKEQHDN